MVDLDKQQRRRSLVERAAQEMAVPQSEVAPVPSRMVGPDDGALSRRSGSGRPTELGAKRRVAIARSRLHSAGISAPDGRLTRTT